MIKKPHSLHHAIHSSPSKSKTHLLVSFLSAEDVRGAYLQPWRCSATACSSVPIPMVIASQCVTWLPGILPKSRKTQSASVAPKALDNATCWTSAANSNGTPSIIVLSGNRTCLHHSANSGVTGGLNQGEKLAERGSLATVGRPLANTKKKSWKMIVNPDVDGYIKIRKILRKMQKTTYWKPKE